jgi:hypothetical protein
MYLNATAAQPNPLNIRRGQTMLDPETQPINWVWTAKSHHNSTPFAGNSCTKQRGSQRFVPPQIGFASAHYSAPDKAQSM